MIGKVFEKFLDDEDELDLDKNVIQKPKKVKEKFSWKSLIIPLLIFLIAFIPRIIYIFFLSNPNFTGWYTDTFHHWQIAYLSKEVGFSHGFLRLWDFKGMEFFWGLLHPLVLVILFYLTGSISILIPKLLSAFGGSISIVLLFILIKKYFNQKTAWAVAIFASFFPITLFSNTVGMQEELGMPLILGAILLFPQSPAITGILFALASMVRAEYWVFSLGLLGSLFFLKRKTGNIVQVFISYFVIMIFYMKYLATWTGSFIFPIKLNFLASVKGDWFEDLPVIGEKLLAKRISQGIFSFGIIGGILTLIKKPKHALLYLFGFANIVFIGFMVGFGAYVKGYIPRFWVDRLYNWPYLFTAILVIIFLFYFLPKVLGKFSLVANVFAWVFLLFGILISQYIWKPINFFMEPIEGVYNNEKVLASEIASNYKGGTILLPEDHPYVTYFLAHDYKIEAKNMQGQMFDPFFYFENKDKPFSNWGEDREVIIDWLKNDNIKLIVLTQPKPTYLGLVEREPQLFKEISSLEYIRMFRVEIN